MSNENTETKLSIKLFKSLSVGELFIAHGSIWVKVDRDAASILWNQGCICSFNLSAIDSLIIPVNKDFPNLSEFILNHQDSKHLERENLLPKLTEKDQSLMNTAEAFDLFFTFDFYSQLCDENKNSVNFEDGCNHLNETLALVKEKYADKPYCEMAVNSHISYLQSLLSDSSLNRDEMFELITRNKAPEKFIEYFNNEKRK